MPVEHVKAVLDAEGIHESTPALKRDPFIYNPTKDGLAASIRPTLVQHDIVEVFVTLQNPFQFDLEIQNIELR